jgi:hypothetical protein
MMKTTATLALWTALLSSGAFGFSVVVTPLTPSASFSSTQLQAVEIREASSYEDTNYQRAIQAYEQQLLQAYQQQQQPPVPAQSLDTPDSFFRNDYQVQPKIIYSTKPLKSVIQEAIKTFQAFRELQAAGLLPDKQVHPEAIRAARNKAAENFEAFREYYYSNEKDPSTSSNVEEGWWQEMAAILGRKTGKVLGGVQPENYIE